MEREPTLDRMEHNDGRLRVWLPKDKRWIREALAHVVNMRELAGTPSSISNEVVMMLEEKLKWFVKDAAKKEKGTPN